MSNTDKKPKHLRITQISPWVKRWSHLIDAHKTVLDLASGGGRHGRYFLGLGCLVSMVDKNIEALADLKTNPLAAVIQADLEDGSPWPLKGRTFDGIVVVNYLHRPLFDKIIASLNPGGVLIYETFAVGNEVYSRPRNPNHLLKNGELLDLAHEKLNVLGYEHGLVTNADITGVKQRLCALKNEI